MPRPPEGWVKCANPRCRCTTLPDVAARIWRKGICLLCQDHVTRRRVREALRRWDANGPKP